MYTYIHTQKYIQNFRSNSNKAVLFRNFLINYYTHMRDGLLSGN